MKYILVITMSFSKRMKGISLPVNLIVILAVGIIVMVIAVFLVAPWALGPGSYVKDTEAWQRGCGIWRQRGCLENDIDNIIIAGYDPDGDGQPNNLMVACQRAVGYTSREDCRRACCLLPETGQTTTTP